MIVLFVLMSTVAIRKHDCTFWFTITFTFNVILQDIFSHQMVNSQLLEMLVNLQA